MTHTRLNIENAIGIVARSQADTREVDYATMKRIFRYLKGKLEFRLYYHKSNNFTLYTLLMMIG